MIATCEPAPGRRVVDAVAGYRHLATLPGHALPWLFISILHPSVQCGLVSILVHLQRRMLPEAGARSEGWAIAPVTMHFACRSSRTTAAVSPLFPVVPLPDAAANRSEATRVRRRVGVAAGSPGPHRRTGRWPAGRTAVWQRRRRSALSRCAAWPPAKALRHWCASRVRSASTRTFRPGTVPAQPCRLAARLPGRSRSLFRPFPLRLG